MTLLRQAIVFDIAAVCIDSNPIARPLWIRRTASARLQHVGLLVPPGMVTADDARQEAPVQDPCLLAAERLGVPPHACLVVEGAPPGIPDGRGGA